MAQNSGRSTALVCVTGLAAIYVMIALGMGRSSHVKWEGWDWPMVAVGMKHKEPNQDVSASAQSGYVNANVFHQSMEGQQLPVEERSILGTWRGTSVKDGIQMDAEVTYQQGGNLIGSIECDNGSQKAFVSYAGSWKLEGKTLRCTYTSSNRSDIIPVPMDNVSEVVSVTPSVLTERGADGSLEASYRSTP